jgi:hypothetical protein
MDHLKALYPQRPLPFACLNWEHVPEASQLALDCRVREVRPSALNWLQIVLVDIT